MILWQLLSLLMNRTNIELNKKTLISSVLKRIVRLRLSRSEISGYSCVHVTVGLANTRDLFSDSQTCLTASQFGNLPFLSTSKKRDKLDNFRKVALSFLLQQFPISSPIHNSVNNLSIVYYHVVAIMGKMRCDCALMENLLVSVQLLGSEVKAPLRAIPPDYD